MPVEYDKRRPRLPVELAKVVDARRGQVPFNRFVVQTLKEALGGPGAVRPSGVSSPESLSGKDPVVTASHPAPSRAPVPQEEPPAIPKIAKRHWSR